MKEASGEANMTVITIVLIGVIAAIAIPVVNSAMSGMAKQACCQSYGGYWKDSKCKDGSGNEIGDDNYWDSTDNTCKVG